MVPARDENPVRVLLVEDSSADAKLVQTLLRKSATPFTMEVVTDGEAALKFLLKQDPYRTAPTPDLILLDLNLPKKNGKEVLEEVKAHTSLCGIPVIVLSTSHSDEDISNSYSLHANSFITKPNDLEEFISVIQNIESFWLRTARLPHRSYLEA